MNGFYEKLGGFLDHIVGKGFVSTAHRQMLQINQSPAGLLDALSAWQPSVSAKWVDSKPS